MCLLQLWLALKEIRQNKALYDNIKKMLFTSGENPVFLKFKKAGLCLFKCWPWSCWTQICSAFANSVDPGQLASSASFVIKYVNYYQQPGSSNLIGWKLEMGVVSLFIQHGKG